MCQAQEEYLSYSMSRSEVTVPQCTHQYIKNTTANEWAKGTAAAVLTDKQRMVSSLVHTSASCARSVSTASASQLDTGLRLVVLYSD